MWVDFLYDKIRNSHRAIQFAEDVSELAVHVSKLAVDQ